MSLTQVLAIIGAVTGVTGALLGILSFVRDRARLIVYSVTRPSEEYVVFVINAGRQPVAVISVAMVLGSRRYRTVMYAERMPVLRRLLKYVWVRFAPDQLAEPLGHYDEPLLLKPGQLKRYVVAPSEIKIYPHVWSGARYLYFTAVTAIGHGAVSKGYEVASDFPGEVGGRSGAA